MRAALAGVRVSIDLNRRKNDGSDQLNGLYYKSPYCGEKYNTTLLNCAGICRKPVSQVYPGQISVSSRTGKNRSTGIIIGGTRLAANITVKFPSLLLNNRDCEPSSRCAASTDHHRSYIGASPALRIRLLITAAEDMHMRSAIVARCLLASEA